MEKIIKKCGAKKSISLTFIITGMVSFLAGLYFIYDGATMENYFGRNDDLKTQLFIYGAILIISAIPVYMRGITTNKMSICVCEDKIYGVGSKPPFFSDEAFEYSYNEIVSVSTKSSTLVIECKAKKHFLDVENSKEVCKLIQNRMNH